MINRPRELYKDPMISHRIGLYCFKQSVISPKSPDQGLCNYYTSEIWI